MVKLTNTDGDPVCFCTVHAKLRISPERAVNRLLPLTQLSSEEDLLIGDDDGYLDDGEYDYRFKWLQEGADKYAAYHDDSVLGVVTITDKHLTVDVNSENGSVKSFV